MRTAVPESRDTTDAARDRLLRRYAEQGRPSDLERLVVSYRSLARALARRYMTAASTREDFEQAAYEGLVKALHRFDPDRGASFTSFAVPTILGELRRHVRDTLWPAHVPRVLQERVRSVRATARQLTAARGRSPTVRELADELEWNDEAVAEAIEVTSSLAVVPLDGACRYDGDGAATIGDQVGAEDDGYERVECLAALEQALPALPPHEQQALRLHFGEDMTQRQIASRLGVPRSQVARDLAAAVRHLRVVTAERVAA